MSFLRGSFTASPTFSRSVSMPATAVFCSGRRSSESSVMTNMSTIVCECAWCCGGATGGAAVGAAVAGGDDDAGGGGGGGGAAGGGGGGGGGAACCAPPQPASATSASNVTRA